MSKQSNPAMIGGFVVGAMALLVISTLIFGGSELLKDNEKYVSYFDGSVKGLRVGSSVLFRGVRIGYVTDINLIASVETLEAKIPVVYEVDHSKFLFVQGRSVLDDDDMAPGIDAWIDAGLRAQLDSESFVTGQLVIELDFYPDTDAEFRNETLPYEEIPSITSGIAQIIEDAQRFVVDLQTEFDVKEISAKVNSILDGVDELANSPEMREAIAGLDTIVNSPDTQNIPKQLSDSLDNLNAALSDTRTLINDTNENVAPVAASLANTLTEAEKLLRGARAQLDGESVIAVQLGEALTEVSSAARSIRALADYLEQNPEAIIRGKQ